MELSELEKLVQVGEVDTVIVGFTDLYGRLMGKRCDAEFFLEEVARDVRESTWQEWEMPL